MLKQYIIVRKDLTEIAPVGKMMSQAGHAAYSASKLSSPEEIAEWEEGLETKITLSVKGETQMLNLIAKLEEADIPFAKIVDAGRTVFDGPTLTCLGVGPIKHDKLHDITRKLQLLK